MEQLRISVVIPTFHRANLVERALKSVLVQLDAADEVLVVDDGSTDNTEAVVRKFGDDRVRYIWQQNAGAGAARNHGVKLASGDLVGFLDSDDEWLPGKVAVQRAFMAARPDILVSFNDFARDFGGRRNPSTLACWNADQNGWKDIMGTPVKYSSITSLPAGISDFDVYFGDVYRVEMHASYLSVCTMMVRRLQVRDALRFAEGVATWEDWECFGRLARLGTIAHLDYVGRLQHAHTGPRVTDAGWVDRAESRLVILRNVWGSDPEFLAKHGEEYRALVHQQHLLKVRSLITAGRLREARETISQLNQVPLQYKLASRLPKSFITSVVSLRRSAQSAGPEHGHEEVA
jgi:glycosyltransferase involved in cell wall biosynthesis